MNYEINFLILQSKTIDLLALRQKVKEIIQTLGGKISEEKEYAKRKLAYRIKKEGYGFHTVLRFSLEKTEKINDLKKALNLEEKISRYLIVKADELLSLKELDDKLKKAVEEKTNLSQDELNKILQKKDSPVVKETASEKEEKAIQPKILNQEAPNETQEMTPKKEAPAVVEEKEKTAPEKKVEKTEIKTEKNAVEKKATKEDKLSMDELDKKLDEILNI